MIPWALATSTKCWPTHCLLELSLHGALLQVEVEKELRRQLLEVDEHSSHQARQLDLLQLHTLAMHTLAPGHSTCLPLCVTSCYHEQEPVITKARYLCHLRRTAALPV